MTRTLNYFVADVHLGLRGPDREGRERRFLQFLDSIPAERTQGLYLLGDIWDFWYEYHDVVPREAARVVCALVRLMDAGVQVFFVPGNHDVWTYSFFESLGMRRLEQPAQVEIGGKQFCLGHWDGLGDVPFGDRLIGWIFHNKVLQALFSTLHPWFAYRLGIAWSSRNRQTHGAFVFDEKKIPLRGFVEAYAREHRVDAFIFGHYHHRLDTTLAGGERFLIVGDWIGGENPYVLFDGETLRLTSFSAA
ncbi:MAG: UDP-2,3-diacylglucosamine diphosphatase [Bacteroidales bacterium]|nr:UDP-2,3-diacylglucosamine diphosphatase [Bacteroidales bacterium]